MELEQGAALWGEHASEGRFRLLADLCEDAGTASHESGKSFQNLRPVLQKESCRRIRVIVYLLHSDAVS